MRHGFTETKEFEPRRASRPYGSCGLASAQRAEGVSRQSEASPGKPDCPPDEEHSALLDQPNPDHETGTILAGHGRWEAARRLGMAEVPTVTISGLSDSDKRAVVIADNRLPEQAVWDFDLLRGHFQDLISLDFDVELTGFSTGEIDLLIDGSQRSMAADPADDLAGLAPEEPAVSQVGDVWELGTVK
jgi:hypothetical protein